MTSLVGASDSLQRHRRARSRTARGRCPAAQRPRHGRPARPLARPLPEPARPGPERPGAAPRPAQRSLEPARSSTRRSPRCTRWRGTCRRSRPIWRSSDALLPRLVKDKEYGREVTEQLRQFVERLNEVSREALDRGTARRRKLINDPQIYDAVNDIIVGVNESRILRWLIRNRQKKGIEKRYDDTKKAIEEAGGTPAPLDKLPETPEETPTGGSPAAPGRPAPAAEPTATSKKGTRAQPMPCTSW